MKKTKVFPSGKDSYFGKTVIIFRIFLSNYDGKSKWASAYFAIAKIIHVFTLFTMIISAFYVFDDPDSLIVLAHHFMIFFAGFTVFAFLDHQKKNFKFLIEEIPLSYDYESEMVDRFQKEIYTKSTNKFNKLFYLSALYVSPYVFVNNNIFSFFDWLSSSNSRVLLTYPFPFPSLTSSWVGYIGVLLWENVIILHLVYPVMVALSFLGLIFLHIHCEFKILTFALKNIKERIKENMRENQKIDKVSLDCVKQCVEHHCEIIKCFEVLKIVTKPLFTMMNIVAGALFICTGIITLANNTSIRLKLASVSILQYIYIYICCMMGQSIANMSEEIAFAAYDTNITELPISSRKALNNISLRALKTLEFETSLGIKVNAPFFMDLMKGSYSYISMLNQMNE